MEDPRQAARYLGSTLRPLPPEVIAGVLENLLERAERRERGAELAVEAILCREMRSGWPEGLSRQVQRAARVEGHFDVAAMLLDLPATDARFVPGAEKLPKVLRDIPLGVRKSMARRQDIDLMARLLSDPDERVVANLLDNPRLTVQEVIRLAADKETRGEVLEEVAAHPRWVSRYRVKVALAFNPATPTRVALGLLRLLMSQDLEELGRDGRVSEVISRRARDILRRRRPEG